MSVTVREQMNNLRVSQLERNKEIMLIKRQLLLQEVNNVLLQAHITRREVELYQYREARRHAAVKRWSTFSTSDRAGRSQVTRTLKRTSGTQIKYIFSLTFKNKALP